VKFYLDHCNAFVTDLCQTDLPAGILHGVGVLNPNLDPLM
jgi:hypothetical protein